MDLFKLLGTITINNSDANEALEETGQTAEKTQGKLSKAFSAVGKGAVAVGKTIGVGLMAGGAAMGTLTIKAMNLSGELEQNMGGSEQVFKEYASKMQETARSAFENMGLSTSDFLGTANKMGALFQGAGFSIEESSGLASDAMQRAADVASIMGIDTASAMEAIAGAAKGNFTMMDNLGVAMNDTTLNAYAMEKGIEKTTQEMTNQEKIGLAMEMFMEKTAYAAGNYARENETLAGSLGTAKAALTNFLDGSGDVDSLVTAFSNAANVIVKNLGEIAPRLVSGLTEIINQIIPMLPPLLQQLLPVIVEGAVSLINGLVAALPTVLNAVISALPALIQGVQQIINALLQALPQIIQSLVSALPTLIPILVTALVSMIVMLCEMLPQIIQPIIDYLPDIINSIVDALITNLPVLIEGLITLVLGIVQAIPQIIQTLVDATPTIIKKLVTALLKCLPQLLTGIGQIITGIVRALPTLLAAPFEQVIGFLTGLWEGIKEVFAPVAEWFGGIFTEAKEKIAEFFAPIGEFFQGVWNRICEIFAPVVNFFKVMFENAWIAIQAVWSVVAKFFEIIWALIRAVFEPVVNWFKNIFSQAWEGIKAIWNTVIGFFSDVWANVKEVFSPVVNFFKNAFNDAWEAIKKVFSSVGEFFGGIWETIKEKFSKIGTKIGDSISGAVKSAINGVIGSIESIINGFFGLINGAINLINEIPGVEISKLELVKFTRLAKGGVVDKPTPAVFGEDGAEAVVPLENNTGWLNKVALKLHELTMQYKNSLGNNISIRSVELQHMQVSELQTLNVTANKILEAILALDENMGGNLREALEGVSFDVNKREFARLVKGAI